MTADAKLRPGQGAVQILPTRRIVNDRSPVRLMLPRDLERRLAHVEQLVDELARRAGIEVGHEADHT